MATVISHAVAGWELGPASTGRKCRSRSGRWPLCAQPLLTWIVIGFGLGIDYADPFGHRGFTHSLFFAALLAAAVVGFAFPKGVPGLRRFPLWLFFFLATASHGFLDAMTNSGLGVAFFAPFDNIRYFFPWTPIQVSPIGITNFIADGGLSVFPSELLWIWFPSATLAAFAMLVRGQRSTPRSA